MQTLTGIAFLCLLGAGCIHGQADILLELPDYDVFSLDFRNDQLFQDRDIFEDDPEPSDNAAVEIIERLCTDYDILLENQHIDCKKLKLVEKALRSDQHSLQKRDAEDDVPLEGSGEGEGPIPEYEEGKVETEPAQVEEEPATPEAEVPNEVEAPVEVKEEAPASVIDQADEQSPEAEPVKESENTEATAEVKEAAQPVTEVPEIVVNEIGVEPATDNKEVEIPTNIPPESESVPSEAEQPVLESATKPNNEEEVVVPLDINVEPDIQLPATLPGELLPTDSDLKQATTVLPPQEPKEEIAGPTTDLVDEVQEAVPENAETPAPTATGIKKKGRILRPEVPQTETSKEPEKPIGTGADKEEEGKQAGEVEADKAKEAEKLNEQQSGNAIVDGVDAGTLEASDVAVKRMEPNAKIKEAATDSQEPKSGESTKETQQARKDTKILIVLFVAVVVVGAAAFTYNFIKKRKQKKEDEGSREENGGGNALKRSLQNLTGSTDKVDPEQGRELKPLMTNNSDQKPAVAEYTDEKENVKVGDGK